MCNVVHCHFFVTHACFKAVSSCERNICCFRNLARRESLSPFPCTHPCNASANQAVKDVSKSYDALLDLFESIENFLSRLDIYTKIPLTTAMKDVIVKILAEVLSTLALATKQVKQGRLSESLLADAGL